MGDSSASIGPHSWHALIEEVKACSAENVEGSLPKWAVEIRQLWRNEDDQWVETVELLPQRSVDSTVKALFVGDLPPVPEGHVAFLSVVACEGHLSGRIWTDQLSDRAVRFVAGCVVLFGLASRSSIAAVQNSLEEMKGKLTVAVASYPLTIALLRVSSPELVTIDSGAYTIAGAIAVPSTDLRPREDDAEARAVLELLSRTPEQVEQTALLLREMGIIASLCACRIIRKAIASDEKLNLAECLKHTVDPFREELDEHSWGRVVADAVEKCEFYAHDQYLPIFDYSVESSTASEAFCRAYDELKPGSYIDDRRKTLMELWARFLPQDEAFGYCWRVCVARDHKGEYLFGTSVDSRIESLRRFMFEAAMRRHDRKSLEWREALVQFMRPVASLIELRRSRHRLDSGGLEEAAVRQQEAIDVVEKHPGLISLVVEGILDLGHEEWDVLDPVILGLGADCAVDWVEGYLESDHSDEPHYHARRLLAHLKGAVPCLPLSGASDRSMLGAVESLVSVSRSALGPRRSELWLGDRAVESLWAGAADAAAADFQQHYDSQYGQDEHEHVAVLAEALARRLNATNTMVAAWLSQGNCQKAFLNASVRRFPKTAPKDLPQEGGKRGVQADLAILLKVDIPGLALADRVTLIQAKKVAKASKGIWEPSCGINGTQLKKLLELSSCAHYVFFAHSELGPGAGFLPALLVRNVCQAQQSSRVPVPLVLRAAKSLSSFLVHDVIGLWTGDPRRDLVEMAESGAELGQGPRVVLTVQVSREREHE